MNSSSPVPVTASTVTNGHYERVLPAGSPSASQAVLRCVVVSSKVHADSKRTASIIKCMVNDAMHMVDSIHDETDSMLRSANVGNPSSSSASSTSACGGNRAAQEPPKQIKEEMLQPAADDKAEPSKEHQPKTRKQKQNARRGA